MSSLLNAPRGASHPVHRIGFVDRLSGFGTQTSLIVGDRSLSYAELHTLVLERADALGPDRTLVLVEGGNELEFVVTYLAALVAGHPVWLTRGGDGAIDSAAEVFRPGVVARADRGGFELERRTRTTTPDPRLHPDLAMLLSTSGSTGSAKLVRLSHDNVSSNADAIATYLRLTAADRAITTLPLHYCYGLSVLNSHLAVGASVVLTSASVVDPCFWSAVERHQVTNLAGVPHTFDLLDRAGFADRTLPSLRFVTQAGGRLPPERVRAWTEIGRERGWDLVAMYGQTEATARMAYLPPDLAIDHPGAVGVPIPGGSFRLRPLEGAGPPARVPVSDGFPLPPDVGEIMYSGPNVMLGYAESAADLALGRTVEELATGDLGRFDELGLLHVVGRVSRFIKPFGVRVDLDRVEAVLASTGVQALCAGDDRRLDVLVRGPAVAAQVRDELASRLRLPSRLIAVHVVDELPVLPNGKPDRAAATRLCCEAAVRGDRLQDDATGARRRRGRRGEQTVRAAFAGVLGDDLSGDATFVEMGGDSLSYVEVSVRLEDVLGYVPTDWHLTPLRDLEGLRPRRSRWARMETGVVLRAVAISLIVGTHMHLFRVPGGAHVLLALAGFNFARFQLGATTIRARVRSALATVGRVAVPTSLWIGAQMALVGGYSAGTLLLVNNYTGSSWRREGRWHYWYFEAFVQLFVVCTALLCVAPLGRLERRRPFWFAMGLLLAALALRFELIQLGDPYNYLYRTHTVAWFFLIGWAAHRASTLAHRALLSLVVLAAVPGFFEFDQRNVAAMIGLLLIVWVPQVIVPRCTARAIATLAAASMYIFLVHWQVWPPLDRALEREIAYPLTIALGVLVWWSVERTVASARRRVRSRRGEPARVSAAC